MFYTVYRTTNQINGKFYVGAHITEDLEDGYLGSGKLIMRAIKKDGEENFTKEYLGFYDTEHKMNLAEKILAVVDPEVSYNLCSGGKRNFDYINTYRPYDEEKWRERLSIAHKGLAKNWMPGIIARAKKTKGKKIDDIIDDPDCLQLRKQAYKIHCKRQLENGTHSSQIVRQCPHCDKIGKGTPMFRWHFDNCKHRKDIE